jgi:hypothetical protein
VVDNQHQKIKGYRDLSQAEIDAMNECKELAVKVGDLCNRLAANHKTDARWVAIGKIDLQKGFMAIIRSIAQPETF